MIDKIQSVFIIPELRQKITFTLLLLIVVRVGAHIPIPGVDGQALTNAFGSLENSLFGLFNTFVGGAFAQASLFSLGIMPYISSSIIIQLMGSVIPYFQRLQKEGKLGEKNNPNNEIWYGFVSVDAIIWCGCCFFTELEFEW